MSIILLLVIYFNNFSNFICSCAASLKSIHLELFFSLLEVRFLSDLVNCHVIAAPSMVAMFENFVSVTQEEDVPQVSKRSVDFLGLFHSMSILFVLFLCLEEGGFRESNLNGLTHNSFLTTSKRSLWQLGNMCTVRKYGPL